MNDRRERDGRLKQVAELDRTAYPVHDSCRRIYSADGLAPTIQSHSGGNREPKILVEGSP